MIEVEVRQNNMELGDAAEQCAVCDQTAYTRAGVEEQRTVAVAYQHAARLTRPRGRASAAAKDRDVHVVPQE